VSTAVDVGAYSVKLEELRDLLVVLLDHGVTSYSTPELTLALAPKIPVLEIGRPAATKARKGEDGENLFFHEVA
jgi:hypothetical protein